MHDVEITEMTSRPMETWNPHLAPVATRQVFIYWKPLALQYLNINFDGSISDNRGGAGFVIHGCAGFVIHGIALGLLAARESHLYEPRVPRAELHDTWSDIFYI